MQATDHSTTEFVHPSQILPVRQLTFAAGRMAVLVLALIFTGNAGWVAAQDSVKDPFQEGNPWTKLLADANVRKQLEIEAKDAGQLEKLLGAPDADSAKKLAELLTEKQLRTVRKIRMKSLGGYALLHSRMAKYLELSDEQAVQLKAAAEQNLKDHAEMKNFMARARFRSAADAAKYVQGYRDKAHKRLFAVLTKDQQAKYDKIFTP